MKKKILCLVLAITLVGSAVAFFVWGKVGNSYPYAKRDMSKYITIASTDFVRNLYTGKTSPDEVTADDVKYAIAKALAEKQEKGDVGVIELFDTLYVKYYGTIDDNGNVKIVTKTSALDPEVNTTVQVGSDSDFARLLEAYLIGRDASKTAYRAFTKGAVLKGDKIRFEYKKNGASDDAWKNLTATVKGDTFLDTIAEGLTAKFLEKMAAGEAKIDTALELTLGDDTYSITVNYALRDKIVGGGVQDGDTVNFLYYEVTVGNEGTETEGKGTTYSEVLSDKLDETFGAGFYAALKAMTIGEKSDTFTTTKTEDGNEVTKNYRVLIEYAEGREDTSALEDGQLEKAENYLTFEKQYAVDADIKDESVKDGESLAGKTVKYYIAVTNVKSVDYNYETITGKLKFEAEKDSKLSAYFEAYEAYNKAKGEYEDAKALTGDKEKTEEELAGLENAMNSAKEAFDTAESEYLDSLEAEDGSRLADYKAAYKAFAAAEKNLAEAKEDESTTEEKLVELETAVTEAKEMLESTLLAYARSEDVLSEDVTLLDLAAISGYREQKEEEVEEDKKDKFSYAVAKEVWNALLEQVKDGVKYPSRAVKVAYRGLIDEWKSKYYENRDKEPYSQYSTFKSYLKQSAYAGKDYKAELTSEAQQIVLEKMVLYRLVELYDVTLNETQEMMIKFYTMYMDKNYCEEVRAAYLFDNVMQKIAEQVCPAIADTDAD